MGNLANLRAAENKKGFCDSVQEVGAKGLLTPLAGGCQGPVVSLKGWAGAVEPLETTNAKLSGVLSREEKLLGME